MENLSDVCYLLQLIVRQVSIYLRDLILYKFFRIAAANDDFDTSDAKLHGLTFRDLRADIVTFSLICAVLFILVLIASKYEKDSRQLYASACIETMTADLQEDPYSVSRRSSTDCFHACGDSICSRARVLKRNFSDEGVTRTRSDNKKRATAVLKRSIFGLNDSQSQNLSRTRIIGKLSDKNNQKWLIRRTRSGHIYGKYPI